MTGGNNKSCKILMGGNNRNCLKLTGGMPPVTPVLMRALDDDQFRKKDAKRKKIEMLVRKIVIIHSLYGKK